MAHAANDVQQVWVDFVQQHALPATMSLPVPTPIPTPTDTTSKPATASTTPTPPSTTTKTVTVTGARNPSPPASLAPGCYLKQSEASPRECGGPFLDWARDVWGEANANSAVSEVACLSRKEDHDAYCEVSTEWLFVGTSSTLMPEDTSSISFASSFCMDLRKATGATFQGAIILIDDDVDLCRDCAQRCFFEMIDCVGFVLEPKYDNNPQFGQCTYFSRIDSIKSTNNLGIVAFTTAAQSDGLTMLALVRPHGASTN